MKILIAIDAPSYGNTGEFHRRAAQFEQNEIGRMIQLLGSRVQMGQASGEITSGDGKAVLRWKTEQSAPAAMNGEAAA
jgi:hypothetical protein